MQESLKEDSNLAPEGHPVNILMEEHSLLLEYANELRDLYKQINEKESFTEIEEELNKIEGIIKHLKASESHYLREENILFSYLEKYGVTQPPKIMWMEHDRIRDIEKKLYSLIENKDSLDYKEFIKQYHLYAHGLAELFANHFSKENRVLFPTAMQLCKESEWIEMRKQFDEVGYCCFTPVLPYIAISKEKTKREEIDSSLIDFGTGALSLEQLLMIFKTLPVDITYVNEENIVKFYSEGPDRIFVRAPSVIGRLVENCHPDKSVNKVLAIIEGFKNKTLDKAEFWLNLGEKLVYIRYFPLRNEKGEYKGVLEVTQNISDIKKLDLHAFLKANILKILFLF